MPMEIRGDLSYWIKRIQDAANARRINDPTDRLPQWVILSARNWAEIKMLIAANHWEFYHEVLPKEPSIFAGLKVAIADLFNSDSDFLEVA